MTSDHQVDSMNIMPERFQSKILGELTLQRKHSVPVKSVFCDVWPIAMS